MKIAFRARESFVDKVSSSIVHFASLLEITFPSASVVVGGFHFSITDLHTFHQLIYKGTHSCFPVAIISPIK